MNAKLKAKWVKALRSGEYEQAHRALYNGAGFCCLGVLGVVCGVPLMRLEENAFLSTIGRSPLRRDDEHALATLNDAGVPFEMIAGLIEEAL
jgi:hypothetical protein